VANIAYCSIGMSSTLHGSIELVRRLMANGHEVTVLSHVDHSTAWQAVNVPFVHLTELRALCEQSQHTRSPLKTGQATSPGAWRQWFTTRRQLRHATLQSQELRDHLQAADLVLADMETHYALITGIGLGRPMLAVNFLLDVHLHPSVPPLNSPLQPGEGLLDAWRAQWHVWQIRWINYTWRWGQRFSRKGLVRMLRPVDYNLFEYDDAIAMTKTHKLTAEQTDGGQWLRPLVYPTVPTLCLNLQAIEFTQPKPENLHYVGPMINLSRAETSLQTSARRAVDSFIGRHNVQAHPGLLVYCTMGTFYSANQTLLANIIRVFVEREDWSLILSLGQKTEAPKLDTPDNVYIADWVAQMSVMEAADCAIVHGGISTLYEAIQCTLPTLMYDTGHIDQPGNIARATYKKLGVKGGLDDTPQQIAEHITNLCQSEEIETALTHMHALIEQSSAERCLETLIDQHLEDQHGIPLDEKLETQSVQ